MAWSTVERRLSELGVSLPPAPPPVGAYVGVVRTGNLLVTSGQLPWVGDRLFRTGRVGTELTVEEGYQCARICALNALAQLLTDLASLDHIKQIVRVEGYVHCAPGFRDHPKVLNGASDLLNQAFGEKGQHTRTALGIADMPLNAPVQLVLWAEEVE
jgi:enamine deaminase RidA (YjgF/YER057c/UK114 family)